MNTPGRIVNFDDLTTPIHLWECGPDDQAVNQFSD
jgi:hypothetical protein